MRSIITLVFGLLLCTYINGQTVLFTENFEANSLPDSITHVGNGVWGKSSKLFSGGSLSDSLRIDVTGDSVVATTQSFSTTGNSFVMLYFNHICKIEFFDEGYIEVSNNNGTTWTRLTANEYQGLSQFATQGNKFSSGAYVDWAPGVAGNPTNAWWKPEVFDISLLVGNASNVKIRFVLRDAVPGSSMGDNYAWFIDNIKVIGAFSELNPPVITTLPPIVQDTVYSIGPYQIRAHITDQSLVDTAYLVYWVNTGTPDTIGMTRQLADTFSAAIPFYGFGKNIHYYVVAIDGSAAHNSASSSTYHFFCKFSTGGTYEIGTGISVNTTSGWPAPYGNWYHGSKHQFLILASELVALGAPGGPIGSLAFNVQTVQGVALQGYTIKMGHTSQSAMTTSYISNLTTTYTSTAFTEVLGWNTHSFQTPFVWNGVDNLVIETCFNNTSYTSNALTYFSATPFVSCAYHYNDAQGVCANPSATYTASNRPNMKMEILGVTSLTLDAGVGQMVYPTGGVIANTPFNVQVKVINYGTDTLSSATINWKLDGILQTPYSWTGSLLEDSLSATLTLGTITLPLGVHHIVAWTDNPNGSPDLNTANDSSSISFMACQSLLSGTYTIGGTNPDFADFSSAIIALDQCGINAPVTFNVAPGTYNEQIEVPFISGASAVNPVIFKSSASDSTSVTITHNALNVGGNYILKMDGSEYVTFKNIKFVPISTVYGTAVVFENGAKNNTLSGNYFVGQPGTTDDLVILCSEDPTSTDNNIMGNRFESGSMAIWFKGVSTFNPANRINITGNVIEGFTSTGIKIEMAKAFLVHQNKITSSVTNGDLKQGIHLFQVGDTLKITGNKITLSGSTNTNGIYFEDCTSYDSLPGLIANNFISILNGSNLTFGMRIVNTSHQKIYHNSLYVFGNNNTNTRGINTVAGSKNIKVLNNNIWCNKYTTLYEGSSCSRSNYNNLYSSENLYGFYVTSYQNYPSLDLYKAASNKDTNSVSTKPYFNTPSDLHIFNGLLNGIALPVSEVTVDIDGDPRHPQFPDIGADEFDPPTIDITVLTIASPLAGCGKTSTEAVTLTLKNVGTDTISSGLSGHFRFHNGTTVTTEPISATIAPMDTFYYTFNATVNMDVTAFGIDSSFVLEVWTTLTGDVVPYNDTVKVDIESFYTPLPPTTANVSVLYGHTATLTAVSNDTLFWFDSPTAVVELFMGAPYVTPPLFDTTTYYVSAGVFSGGLTDVGTGTVVNPASSYPAVYGNWYYGAKHQMLVTAAELIALGNKKGNITSVAFDVTTPNACPPLQSFEVKIGATAIGAVTTNWETGLTQVYTNASYQPVSGWNTHTFTSPFYWDGVSSVIIETCFNNTNYISNGNASMKQTTTSFPSTHYYNGDNATICSAPSTGSIISQRPNMRIGIEGTGCQSAKAPLTVFVTGFPPNDAGIPAILNPVIATQSGIPTPIEVELKNYGTNPLTSVDIIWELDNAIQDTFPWTGNLPRDSFMTVTIDTAVFAGGTYFIKAYTSMPNHVPDTINNNDTAMHYFNACMNGTYTIGPASSGTYDYNTFTGALNTIAAAGVCGHVVFDVYPGTYNEQLSISEILGVDANNTVTFRGASGDSTLAVLQYTATGTADNWTVRLNGADWFNFERLTIKANNVTYGRVVEMTGGAMHNRFESNRLISAGSSASATGCIYDYNTLNHYNIYRNNYMEGGYYTMYIYGTSSSVWETGTIIEGNEIVGSYYYPMYIYYTDSTQIIGNYIHSGVGPYSYGISVYYTNNAYRIVGNRVEIVATAATACYGMRDYYCNYYSYNPNPTGYGLVANNMISIVGGTGAHYGLYAYYSNGTEYYYNSIHIENGSTTARALYQGNTASNTLGQTFINNIFSSAGGGYAAYFTTPAQVTVSDYNNFFSSASNLAYWGANYGTLAALQAASGKDVHSVSIAPPYNTPSDLHLANTILSAKALPLAAVTVDIDGDPRSLMPTIGADEIPLLGKDAGVIAIITPGILTNEGQTYPVEVTVANFGTDTIFSMMIEYDVNGGVPISMAFADTLLPTNTANVMLPSMISPAGNSVICARTSLSLDSNYFNDEHCKSFFGTPLYDATIMRIEGLESGCNIGLDTVSIWVQNLGVNAINSPSPNTVTVSYQVNSLPVVTENFTPVVLPTDSVLFHFATLADFTVTTLDDTFTVVTWIDLIGDNVSYNDSANIEIISLHVPAPPVVNDTTIPYGTSVTLFAQSADSVLWFAQDTATVELHSGAYYTTPVLYTNTTYWAQAGAGFGASSGPYVPGDNIAPLAVASASNCSTGPCSVFNDLDFGVCGTQLVWISTSSPPALTPHVDWIDFEWPAEVNIDGMQIHHANAAARFLTGATLYKWDNGAWVDFHTFSNLPMQCESMVPFPMVTTTKFRITSFQMTGSGQTSNPNFREIEVFEADATGCSSPRVPLVVTVSNQQACDLGVESILGPTSAVNMGSQEIVKIRIKNYGTSDQSNFPVSYRIGNMPVVTETVTATVSANGTYDYSFTVPANLSVGGNTYQFKAWTGISCDNTHQNDTAWKSVTNLLPNYCVSKATSASYSEISNVKLNTLDNTSNPSGAMYTNFTSTVLPTMLSPGVNYNMSITSSFAPSSSSNYNCWVKVWIDFNRDGTFDPVSEMILSQATTNNSLLTANITMPFIAATGNTVMRVSLQQTTTESTVTPCNTYTYGETEDYMVTIAPQAACDAGVIAVLQPGSTAASGAALPVELQFMNFGSDTIPAGALSIAYKLNTGNPVVVPYQYAMVPGQIETIVMPNVTLPMGNNALCVYTILACDSNAFNNEICKNVYGQFQTGLPFFDDFETSNMWYKPAASVNWQYGTPSANIINSAHSGSKVWATNLAGDYTNNADEYLYTPLINFSGLSGVDTISLSFYHWNAMAASDYGRLQYTINNGQTWANLGFLGDALGTNWYNAQSGGIHYFSLTNSGWMYSAFKLDPAVFNGQSDVQFRFHLYSNASGTANGWAIDDFKLSLPTVTNDIGVTAITAPVGDTAAGSSINAVVTITNFGTSPQYSVPIKLTLDGNAVSTEIWSGTLSPLSGTSSYNFVIPYTTPNASYTLCAETQLMGDVYAMNDEFCRTYGTLPAYHDVGISAIVAPIPDATGNICMHNAQLQPWYQYDVVVRIQNYGQNPQTAVPVKYSFYNGGTVYTDTWTGSLAPNAHVDFTLSNLFKPNNGIQQVCAETNLIGDAITANNKGCQAYTGVLCTGIEDQVTEGFVLLQNIPNPASGTTAIGYHIPRAGELNIGVVNIMGQLMHQESTAVVAGKHQTELNVRSFAAGVYYYYIEFEGQRLTKKLVVRH